jgi:hypothetical protein
MDLKRTPIRIRDTFSVYEIRDTYSVYEIRIPYTRYVFRIPKPHPPLKHYKNQGIRNPYTRYVFRIRDTYSVYEIRIPYTESRIPNLEPKFDFQNGPNLTSKMTSKMDHILIKKNKRHVRVEFVCYFKIYFRLL